MRRRLDKIQLYGTINAITMIKLQSIVKLYNVQLYYILKLLPDNFESQ